MDTYVRRPIATNEAGGAAGDDFLVKAEGGYVKLEADLYIKLKAPAIKLVSLPSSETSSSSNELSSGGGGTERFLATRLRPQPLLRIGKASCGGTSRGVLVPPLESGAVTLVELRLRLCAAPSTS